MLFKPYGVKAIVVIILTLTVLQLGCIREEKEEEQRPSVSGAIEPREITLENGEWRNLTIRITSYNWKGNVTFTAYEMSATDAEKVRALDYNKETNLWRTMYPKPWWQNTDLSKGKIGEYIRAPEKTRYVEPGKDLVVTLPIAFAFRASDDDLPLTFSYDVLCKGNRPDSLDRKQNITYDEPEFYIHIDSVIVTLIPKSE